MLMSRPVIVAVIVIILLLLLVDVAVYLRTSNQEIKRRCIWFLVGLIIALVITYVTRAISS